MNVKERSESPIADPDIEGMDISHGKISLHKVEMVTNNQSSHLASDNVAEIEAF